MKRLIVAIAVMLLVAAAGCTGSQPETSLTISAMTATDIEAPDNEGFMRRCLLMEYIDGHNLRKHIRMKDLTWEAAVDVATVVTLGSSP